MQFCVFGIANFFAGAAFMKLPMKQLMVLTRCLPVIIQTASTGQTRSQIKRAIINKKDKIYYADLVLQAKIVQDLFTRQNYLNVFSLNFSG